MNSTEKQPGGLVAAVETGSPASTAGIEPGDVIISLDGHLLDDVIDYQFYFEPRIQVVELERAGQILELELDNTEGGDPGIFFSNVIFDRVRTCSNRCLFCFIEQVPMGLRPPLYLKDDDYRLSFLNGNFITLGNLRESDLTRIIEQRLSPLYISVHATDPEARGLLMGC
ncbi:MAG: PDZ domain-containing protein, partial [Actinomycetota bacterium]